jgi:hypothetical protein
MGGALDSAATGCDVVNGGGEASDGGAAKVISSTGVEGESDALDSALSGSMSPFALAGLISGAAIPFCVPDGGTSVSVVALSRTRLRFGSGGGSGASTLEAEDSV